MARPSRQADARNAIRRFRVLWWVKFDPGLFRGVNRPRTQQEGVELQPDNSGLCRLVKWGSSKPLESMSPSAWEKPRRSASDAVTYPSARDPPTHDSWAPTPPGGLELGGGAWRGGTSDISITPRPAGRSGTKGRAIEHDRTCSPLLVLAIPRRGVGRWYDDFRQMSDDEARTVLQRVWAWEANRREPTP